MKQPDRIRDAVRRAARQARLGRSASCLLCGQDDLEALTRVQRPSVLELHHVVGRANDRELTVVVCLNCHRRLTEGLECAGVSMSEPRQFLERMVMTWRALAVFFAEL
jgi:hypothetical protein